MSQMSDKIMYFVKYGERRYGQKSYILVEEPSGDVVFQNDFKSEVIAESQRRNDYTPVDGSEQTYGEQMANDKRKRGKARA